jgi:glycosyltransferase involved in cell wall biosynthesis
MVNKSISVVIPTFNNVEYIEECLQSVIDDCVNVEYEILVGIDNCEKTLEYVHENYQKYENVKFYFFKEKLGPYVIKNTLANEAKYENLLFFDSDDILKKNAIGLILSNLEQHKIVRFNFLNFTNNINVKTNSWKFSDGVFAIKKSFFMFMGGFEPWVCGADTEFEWRTSKNTSNIIILQNQLFYRRIHDGSLTNSPETNFSSDIRKENQKKIEDKKNKKLITPIELFSVNKYKKINNYKNTDSI